ARQFPPKSKIKTDSAGNVGVYYLRLSKPPEREVIVSIALKTGDKSISIAGGSRLRFDNENWDKPALVVAQLDSKLRAASSALLEVRSGNSALSWSVTFFALTGMLVFFGIYHKFILPYRGSDRLGTAQGALDFLTEFLKTFGIFFSKNRIGILLLFLL